MWLGLAWPGQLRPPPDFPELTAQNAKIAPVDHAMHKAMVLTVRKHARMAVNGAKHDTGTCRKGCKRNRAKPDKVNAPNTKVIKKPCGHGPLVPNIQVASRVCAWGVRLVDMRLPCAPNGLKPTLRQAFSRCSLKPTCVD